MGFFDILSTQARPMTASELQAAYNTPLDGMGVHEDGMTRTGNTTPWANNLMPHPIFGQLAGTYGIPSHSGGHNPDPWATGWQDPVGAMPQAQQQAAPQQSQPSQSLFGQQSPFGSPCGYSHGSPTAHPFGPMYGTQQDFSLFGPGGYGYSPFHYNQPGMGMPNYYPQETSAPRWAPGQGGWANQMFDWSGGPGYHNPPGTREEDMLYG